MTAHSISTLAGLSAAAAILVWLIGFPLHRELVRRNLVDRPNARSSHTLPTARGGGIAIMLVVCAGFLSSAIFEHDFLPAILTFCAVPLAVISFLDDLRPLSARVRFLVHSVAAVVMIWFSFARDSLVMDASGWVLALASFCWLVGYTNAFNFMDGINGISAVQAFITGLGTALISLKVVPSHFAVPLCASLLAGGVLGFLPHNFPRARMFMGDVGSAPIGFLLAALGLVVVTMNGIGLAVPILLLHTNYILDTAITMSRRLLRGEKIYQAHKEHFYQRLVRAGRSHAYVTGWEFALQILTLACALAYLSASSAFLRVMLVVVVTLVWLSFFTWVERHFRRASEKSGRAEVLARCPAA